MTQKNPNENQLNHRALLAIILASYLMIVLDISIVVTALPKIQDSLGLSASALSWMQNAYTLSFGGLLLLGARAGDILGRKRMFMLGLTLFTLSSLIIGLAPNAALLLAARAVQGIGAAILAPSTLALLTANFAEGPERTRAVAWYGSVAGIGASLGLVLGGVLADMLSWRVGFYINVPIGLVLWLAARRHLPESPRQPGQFDLAGALSSTLGMTALVYGIVHSASAGWSDLETLFSTGIGIVLLAFLVFHEGRAAQAIMPLRLFAQRERASAYAARVLFLGAMMGFWFFTTQYLQGVMGFNPFQAGLAFLPMTVVNFAVAVMVPRLTRRFGNPRLLATGLSLSLLGMVWLSQVSAESSYLLGVALPMALIGMGQGGTLSPLTSSGVAGVSPRDAGAASGLVNVAHQLGGSLGLGVLVVVFAAAAPHSLDARADLAYQVGAALMVGCGLLLLALLIVLFFIVRKPRTAMDLHHV
ncbi:MFS transporter [Uliginosibacterium sediminicola]|uniref:MFS transporter n=1 Tax=Uliginosibacterium sediminicola TaxID=2024550 RepID=A0ABU9Z0G8_9RHOO